MKKKLFFFLFFLSFRASSQINIEYPFDNMVVQRDFENTAKVLVSGFTNENVTRVMVRFVAKRSNWGQSTDWTECNLFKKESHTGFSVVSTITGGWYSIEVKSILGSKTVSESNLNAFGVGEVFLIAGQSNAAGQSDNDQKAATDERVVTIFEYDEELVSKPPKFYIKILHYLSLFPTGNGSWCWGELGDKLVKKLNVPVLFLNAALGGSSSTEWKNSILNTSTRFGYPKDVPYRYMKKTLQYYGNTLGFRAILWHQGESDNGIGGKETSSTEYFNNINAVITESRKQLDHPIGWVISKASYGLGVSSQSVINAQNKLISEIPSVFSGPATDDMREKFRNDDLHFTNKFNLNGLGELANRWNDALNDEFFKKCVPKTPIHSLVTTIECADKAQYPNNFLVSNWEENHFSYNFLVDKKDNYYPSNLQSVKRGGQLEVQTSNTIVCDRKPVTLSIKDSFETSILWSNGDVGKSIVVSKAGTYSAVGISSNACVLNFNSNEVIIKSVESDMLPITPKISNINTTLICKESPAVLTIPTPENLETVWNNGVIAPKIEVGVAGNFFAYFREKNGCLQSPNSEVFEVKDISSVALTKIISEKTFVCEGEKITLKTSTPYEVVWSNGKIGSEVDIDKTGEYSYTLKNVNGCTKASNEKVTLTFYKKPSEIIGIERLSPIELEAIPQNKLNEGVFEWKKDDKLLQVFDSKLNINSAGLYSVTTFYQYPTNFRCYSQSVNGTSLLVIPEELNFPFFVYPIPITGNNELNITTLNKNEEFRVFIYTLEGKEIFNKDWNSTNPLKISSLKSGNYFLKINNSEGIDYSRRVFVR